MVNGGDGGKGLAAFKQFRPSLEEVSAEPLTRDAPILPQRGRGQGPESHVSSGGPHGVLRVFSPKKMAEKYHFGPLFQGVMM